VYSPNRYRLYRCDAPLPNNMCYIKSYDTAETEPCSEDESNNLDFLSKYFPPSFSYVDGPESIDCPKGGSDGCRKYIDEYKQVIVVDSQNRVVQFISQELTRNITYHDDIPTSDMFSDTRCDGTAFPANASLNTFYAKDLGCAYKLKVSYDGREKAFSGYKHGDTIIYYRESGDNYNYTIRCDSLEYDHCYEEVVKGDSCKNPYGYTPDYLFAIMLPKRFDYVKKEEVSCPEDGSKGCWNYTDYFLSFAIVDPQGRIAQIGHVTGLQHNDIDRAYLYYDEVDPLALFDDLKCNTTALPPLFSTCPVPSSEIPSSASFMKVSVIAAVAAFILAVLF